MIRFILPWPLATAMLILSFLFPESKSGEFGFTRGMVRGCALKMLGFEEFE